MSTWRLESCGWRRTGRWGCCLKAAGIAEDAAGRPGFADGCVVLVAVSEAGSGILGTITLEPFGPANELAQDETEADIRAFAVAPQAQGQGVGRKLLLAVIECAGKRGVCRLRLCTQVGHEGGTASLHQDRVLKDSGSRLRARARNHPASI